MAIRLLRAFHWHSFITRETFHSSNWRHNWNWNNETRNPQRLVKLQNKYFSISFYLRPVGNSILLRWREHSFRSGNKQTRQLLSLIVLSFNWTLCVDLVGKLLFCESRSCYLEIQWKGSEYHRVIRYRWVCTSIFCSATPV